MRYWHEAEQYGNVFNFNTKGWLDYTFLYFSVQVFATLHVNTSVSFWEQSDALFDKTPRIIYCHISSTEYLLLL